MQSLAAELAQPATAFVTGSAKQEVYAVRWFAPDYEIALCGHGSLAAGHTILSARESDRVALQANDGRVIEVRRRDGRASYELALPPILTEPREWPELAEAVGSRPAAIRWNPAGYAIALFDDPGQVFRLNPDRSKLAALGNIQVSATAPGSLVGQGADITSRVFSGGGHEDAATGSAHAALAPFWCDRLGTERFVAHQASAAGGWLNCRRGGGVVWLGGECADVA